MLLDHGLMQSCRALSSNEAVRAAADAWLAAYEAALAAGAPTGEAEQRAECAWQLAWRGPQRLPSVPRAKSR